MQYRKVRQDRHRSRLPRELIKDCKLFAVSRHVLAIVRDAALDINLVWSTRDSTVQWEYFTIGNFGKTWGLLADL